MRTRLLLICFLLLFLPNFSESCLPSWFRQERSAEPSQNLTLTEPTEETPPTSSSSTKSALETNEIGDPDTVLSDEDSLPTPPDLPVTPSEKIPEQEEEDDEFEYVDDDGEDEDEEETLKYNENAKKPEVVTPKSINQREIERLKEHSCRDYCHHNATCQGEVVVREQRVVAVVPSCHCPHGWEGTRCDRRYVQAYYAPINGSYNQGSSSAIPAFAFLFVMLVMFLAIVVYAYRRMSKRSDDMTYTMSHMCPPEAFTVLKTPNGRPLAVIPNSVASATSGGAQPRVPMRHTAVRNVESTRNNFFSILRSQGTIPSRNLNDDDTPKHYKSVPRVEVSAINYSGHIDFSAVSFQSTTSEASATCPPPSPHVVIEMEEQHFRSPSRSAGEPSSPSTSEPMIPPKLP